MSELSSVLDKSFEELNSVWAHAILLFICLVLAFVKKIFRNKYAVPESVIERLLVSSMSAMVLAVALCGLLSLVGYVFASRFPMLKMLRQVPTVDGLLELP